MHNDPTAITADEVLYAVSRGVTFLNWSAEAEGPPDDEAFPAAVASLGRERERVVACCQFAARTAGEAARELKSVLAALCTSYIDVLTLYYVEQQEEWDVLRAPGGVLEYLRSAKADGAVWRIGATSHQRPLAAAMARSRLLDCLMVRYNAAHRGAEQDVFPVTSAFGMPVIAHTALRWGALLRSTPDDPPGFVPPSAPAWYRFVLQSPAVSVVLSAPHARAELEEDLGVLAATGPLPPAEYDALAAHGERVRAHAGRFPNARCVEPYASVVWRLRPEFGLVSMCPRFVRSSATSVAGSYVVPTSASDSGRVVAPCLARYTTTFLPSAIAFRQRAAM